jgi:hypothetical protein
VSVEQRGADGYFVRSANRMDWAHVFTVEGRGNGEAALYKWGTISFVSTFGNRGYTFGKICTNDRSFLLFLSSCDWPYLANKFWNLESQVFDFHKSVEELTRRLQAKKRNGDITRGAARSCRHEIASLEHHNNEGMFYGQLTYDCPNILRHLDVYDESPVVKHNNPQCDGFRDEIWTPFCAWIREQAVAQP